MKLTELSYGILAGGQSRRMGMDKAALMLRDQTFLNQLIHEFKGLGPLMISVRDRKQGEAAGWPYVADQNPGIGPLEGLRNLLAWAPTDYIFICACDMPFLKHELAEYLAGFISDNYDCIVSADRERIHPLCAIYSANLAGIAGHLVQGGRYSLMRLLDQCRVREADLADSGLPLICLENINTKGDYLRCLKR